MGIAGDFILVVVAGLAGGAVARAIGLPLLVGYVAAGVAVGPHTAGPTVANLQDIERLAEIGVALLLFAIGLEVSLRDLGTVRRIALIGAPLQILATAVLGASVFRAVVGVPWSEAVWFGALAALSSTMVVLKVLSADRTLGTLASRVMVGILVVQDLAVAPLLILLPHLGGTAGAAAGDWRTLVVAVGFVGAMILLGTRVLPRLMRGIVVWGGRELFLVAVVALGVGVGYVTYKLGLSFALGAFVAGLALGDSEVSHQALADVIPLRDVFSLVFFVSVGMLLDPSVVVTRGADIAAIVATVVLGKALICGWLARAFGYIYMAPWLVGLGLAQIGEFGFVLARVGFTGGHLSQETYDLALAATALSITISPVVFRLAVPIGRAWLRRRPSPRVGPDLAPVSGHISQHAIVAGYGRTGRAVVDALRRAAVPVVVVESSPEAAERARADGCQVVWGDIASETLLEAAHVTRARVFVVAVPSWSPTRQAIEHARALNPSLAIVARASSVAHLGALAELGVRAAIQPEFEGGVEMMRQALRSLDRTDDEIDELSEAVRRSLYQAEPPDRPRLG